MGIIKAAVSAIGGALGDQWLEVLEAGDMGGSTVFTSGVPVRQGGSNIKGTEKTVSNGSIIHVYPNQFMILTDGGKVVDYTAEEGYYKVDNSSMPSMFNGQFGDSLKETFARIKYGGVPSGAQRVFFINTQEIKGQKFGTKNPINYFDNFYNAELFLRCHGDYSVKVTDPLLFYSEVIPKNADKVEFEDISEQYLSEFLEALQASINRMSSDGQRISFVTSKGPELSKYMSECLDDAWKTKRGFEVYSVGIASISYDEESQRLINMRNQGAMMSDATIREGYVQSEIAHGLGQAGSNPNGAGTAFMGMGMGMSAAGGFMGAASATNAQQMQAQAAQQAQAVQPAQAAGTWTCSCGAVNAGNFCSQCGKAKPQPGTWTCSCGAVNTGNFCTQCGKPRQ
ncbi:MAG: SPFH domain-containing protein [Lachnospiraceae bacterium]|nr:SPFH domain-containing protein [Lachnospiraceae bacterium]